MILEEWSATRGPGGDLDTTGEDRRRRNVEGELRKEGTMGDFVSMLPTSSLPPPFSPVECCRFKSSSTAGTRGKILGR
jgi:hypothetical protein